MTGIQKTVFIGLEHLKAFVQEGKYGVGDDFADDENQQAFLNDLHDEVIDKME